VISERRERVGALRISRAALEILTGRRSRGDLRTRVDVAIVLIFYVLEQLRILEEERHYHVAAFADEIALRIGRNRNRCCIGCRQRAVVCLLGRRRVLHRPTAVTDRLPQVCVARSGRSRLRRNWRVREGRTTIADMSWKNCKALHHRSYRRDSQQSRPFACRARINSCQPSIRKFGFPATAGQELPQQ
jgi:hypothetical protein